MNASDSTTWDLFKRHIAVVCFGAASIMMAAWIALLYWAERYVPAREAEALLIAFPEDVCIVVMNGIVGLFAVSTGKPHKSKSLGAFQMLLVLAVAGHYFG